MGAAVYLFQSSGAIVLFVRLKIAAEQRHSDFLYHYFICSLVYSAHSCVHEVAWCTGLEAVSAGAKDLDCPVSRIERRVRGKELRLGNHDIRLVADRLVFWSIVALLLQ